MEKKENPPNVPQARPIDKVLVAICKQQDTLKDQIQQKIWDHSREYSTNMALQIQEECGKTLMATVKQKLRLIGRQGVLSTFK